MKTNRVLSFFFFLLFVFTLTAQEDSLRIEKPDGNIMFDISKGSGSFIFENRELFYTIKREVLIDKLSKSLSIEYIKNEDFMIGNHTLILYTDSYIIGKKEFLVK